MSIASQLLKKEQRMQRNRESASLSRKRRKERLEFLETEVNSLGKTNSELRQKLEQLIKENAKLKEENSKVS
jgi:flagellar basal body P-ring protein FlgI